MSRTIPLPTQEYLNECLSYDELTGILTWRVRPLHHFKTDRDMRASNSRLAGKELSSIYNNYLHVKLNDVSYRANRVIWKLVTGCDPDCLIDHDDGDTLNNRWLNLREASHAENKANSRRYKNNTLGIKGVDFRASKGKYRAKICVSRKQIHLGYFDTANEAKAAYEIAAKLHHGEFSRFD